MFKKIAAISAVTVAAAAVAGAVQFHSWSNDVVGRFPEIPNKIARKAYRNFMLHAAQGRYPNISDATSDAEMDVYFLSEVEALEK